MNFSRPKWQKFLQAIDCIFDVGVLTVMLLFTDDCQNTLIELSLKSDLKNVQYVLFRPYL
jgi:hypothetical protein